MNFYSSPVTFVGMERCKEKCFCPFLHFCFLPMLSYSLFPYQQHIYSEQRLTVFLFSSKLLALPVYEIFLRSTV